MQSKELHPEGEYCYKKGCIFTGKGGKVCPLLDDSKTLAPLCAMYEEPLSWDVSGHILKCEECKKGGN